ncbi:MAG: RNase H-like domain-containing protein, partial [Cyanobacteria bacterium J06600_6]
MDSLLGQFIAGVSDDRLREKLLLHDDTTLTFQLAVDCAKEFERVRRDSSAFQHVKAREVSHVLARGYQNTNQAQAKKTCFRCGSDTHLASFQNCPARGKICSACQKTGHFSKVCRAQQASASPSRQHPVFKNHKPLKPMNTLHQEGTEEDEVRADLVYDMFTIHGDTSPFEISLNLDGNQINFQIDTGASVTVLSGQDFKRYFRSVHLEDDRALLRAYSGHTIPTLGTFRPKVCYNSVEQWLSCTVVDNNGPNLMGRDWLRAFNFHPEKMLNNVETVETMLKRYPDVFSEDYGDVKVSCKIEVKPDAVPKFYRPRPVPYALRSKVEAELSRLVTEGIILPKQSSDWAAPIVPVEKADGSIRLCGDYKTTVNSVLTPDHYPLPLIDDLYSKLAGGAHFTKLDLRCAYLQIPVEEGSRKYTTINTHRGLFEFARLPFGVASAVGIFQRIVDNLFRDMPQVCAYLDDILITGKTLSDHLVNLEEVLRRLDEAGLRLNRKKCVFLAPEVEYLGHRIDSKGLHPTKKKLDAIMQAPVPTDASQLKAYLGLLNYYGRFLRNLSSELAPLYELLQKQRDFHWTKRHQMAFEKSKKMIESSSLLVFYDPNKPLILTTDASSYGVGAVLSHTIDGLERPIYCASRTLSQAEKNYSQIEKESLSVVFGVKRFHQFLYGRKFEIHNDHRPLEGLLGEQKGIPTMASGRIRRWALTLSAYTYSFRYKSGK